MTPEVAQRTARDDEVLIQRIRTGERALFYHLIRPYECSVYLVAYWVLKNEADAEEAAQDAILKVFRQLDQFRAETTFRTWQLHIARNEALVHRCKNYGHQTP